MKKIAAVLTATAFLFTCGSALAKENKNTALQNIKDRSKRTVRIKKANQTKHSTTQKDERKKEERKNTAVEIRLGQLKNGKRIIKTISLEDYLRNVVPKECPPTWNENALKAQAVAARTFALKNIGRHGGEGFDLCDSTHCQLYDESSHTPATDRVVAATRGEVITYGGQLINAVFHTDSGGMTEGSAEVWGAAAPYLAPVREQKQNTSPWTKKIHLDSFAKTLGLKEATKTELSPLTVGKKAADRSASGRVRTVKIHGKASDKKSAETVKTITGGEMRKLFALPSTLFDIKIVGAEVVFTGYGAGHGVGMSQNGMNELSKNMDYRAILAFYYKGTKTEKRY